MFESDPLIKSSTNKTENISGWTDYLRELVHENRNIGKAAFLIRDAITEGGGAVDSNWNYDPYDRENSWVSNKVSMLSRVILSSKYFRNFVHGVAFFLVFLSFIEDPQWCCGMDGGCEYVLNLHGRPAFGREVDVDVDYYPSFRMNYLNKDQSYFVEAACLLSLAVYVALMIGRDGFIFSDFLHDDAGVKRFRLIFIVSVVLQWIEFLAYHFLEERRPFTPYLRLIIFISFTDSIQRELKHLSVVLPDLVNILFLFLVLITFYAWIGNTIFIGTEEGSTYFSTLVEGMYTLWICVTTANYPDVMMLAFNRDRVANVFFISFMVIAFYFLVNVALGSVVNAYNRSEREYEENHLKNTKKKLNQAYKLLDTSGVGWIEKDVVMAVFTVLNVDCPEVRHFNDEETQILFAILDKSGNSRIEKDEFMYFSKVMLLDFKRVTEPRTLVEQYFPHLYESRGFKTLSAFISSQSFETGIDIIILLNAIVVFIQSYPQLTGQTINFDPMMADGNLDTKWEVGETIFTIIYCIEMALKILVLGYKKYMQNPRNIFDGAVTILALLSTAYVYYPNQFSNATLVQYIVMARVLRLVRLLVAIPKFELSFRILFSILPASFRVFSLLMCIMYIFSAIGMQCFGGLITRDPNNPIAYSLEDTSFADAEYWGNSFNDMMSGMNVMFNLLVVNNWPQEADGIVAVSGTRFSRFFFILFHLCGVILVNNVVIAFVIDTFMNEFENAQKKSESTESSEATFDASNITGTETSLRGVYKATFKNKMYKRQSVIHHLFNRDSTRDLEDSVRGVD